MSGRHDARRERAAFTEVSILWAEHWSATFPDDLRAVEIHGEPVVWLDSLLAGP
ncbi:hypothetical protein [Sinosporangium siamense]|uniref:hypothetical protein n=1 Tax=Sinosporangium siamense TaxID=1367973 RepID=UPI0019505606|nr:hypothetical protein [Sinosporangium siamense]